MDIVGLVLAAVAETRYLVTSVRERYSSYKEAPVVFDRLSEDLARIERQMDACSFDLNDKIPHASETSSTILEDQFKTIQERFRCATSVLNTLQSGPFADRTSGASSRNPLRKMIVRVTTAKHLREQLERVSSDFEKINNTILIMASILENLKTQQTLQTRSAGEADERTGLSSVPALTNREVLNYDGFEENGDSTPEALLKRHILQGSPANITAAAGTSRSGRLPELHSAQGMAGVGKTVALKGLAFDKDIKDRFQEIHFITLGYDATDEVVVSELSNIVRKSGGRRCAEDIENCHDMREAVAVAAGWFSKLPCLFLVDDVWKTNENEFGYLPVLRQLLSSCDKSRMAISTRDKRIALEAGQAVEFGARESTVSRRILLSYMGTDLVDCSEAVNDCIERILHLCGGLPLALSVVGRVAKELISLYGCTETALMKCVKLSEEKNALLVNEPSVEYRSLKFAMQISLDMLDGELQQHGGQGADQMRHIQMSKLYSALCVLKSQAWAPTPMLSCLWMLEIRETEKVMQKLCNLHLAAMEPRSFVVHGSKSMKDGVGLRLHDLQLQFCQERADEENTRAQWHQQLLNGYWSLKDRMADANMDCITNDQSGCGLVERGLDGSITSQELWTTKARAWWSEEITEDDYIHENIARHLCNAGLESELLGLLLDARWTRLRLRIGGILALTEDFSFWKGSIRSCKSGGTQEQMQSEQFQQKEDLEAILSAIRCSWDYVMQNERILPVQLGGRLFAMLKNSEIAQIYMDSVKKHTKKPFLEALSGFLPDARGALINEVVVGKRCRSLGFSACGNHIVASAGNDVVIVDVSTWIVSSRFKGHSGTVTSVCFLPQSSKVISASLDNTVRIWDANSREGDPFTLEGHTSWVRSVCASSDGNRIASASDDTTVRLWKFDSGRWTCGVLEGHTREVYCVSFSADGARLASASYDMTIRLWDGTTGAATGISMEGHTDAVWTVAFSPDGTLVASGSWDRTIRLWDVSTGAPVSNVFEGHSGAVRSVSFSSDGTRIVSASHDRTMRFWDVPTGRAVGDALQGNTNAAVNCAMLSLDGTRVASGSEDGTMRIWNVAKVDAPAASRQQNSVAVRCVAFSDDDALIAMALEDDTIRLWDAQTREAVGKPLEGHTSRITRVIFSYDGNLLASGSWDGTVRLWNVKTIEPLCDAFEGHTEKVCCVVFSRDSALIASSSSDKTIRLWDVRTRVAVVDALRGHKTRVNYVSFSEDRAHLVSSSRDGCHCVWDVSCGKLLWMSDRSDEDVPKFLSDIDAKAIIERCSAEATAGRPGVEPVLVCNYDDAVIMKDGDDEKELAMSLRPLAKGQSWKYFPNRNEFVAVLRDGQFARFLLHL